MNHIPVILAPMDGMTHAAFRQICFDYGADGATTEMIPAVSYGRARKHHTLFDETLTRFSDEGTLYAQIVGHLPEDMVKAACRLEALKRFDGIEINMGCPATTVVRSGNGSALLKHPTEAIEMLKAVREAVTLPLRLKLRTGWDEACITAPQICEAADRLGYDSITLHGRTRMQAYKGEVDYVRMCSIISAVSIPIYANGAIRTAEDVQPFSTATGAAGICIGRAALKQPWIFEDIRRLKAGLPSKDHDAVERIELLIRLAGLLCSMRPERLSICEMRKFSSWWLQCVTGHESIQAKINTTVTLDEYTRILSEHLDKLVSIGATECVELPLSLDTH